MSKNYTSRRVKLNTGSCYLLGTKWLGKLQFSLMHRPFQKRERTGTSLVVFRLFKKLRHSNERSTKFESLYQE